MVIIVSLKIRNINFKYMIILLTVILILFLFKDDIRNGYNYLMHNNTNNELIYSDDLIKNYVESLENKINDYEDISNINSCINAKVIYRNPSTWYEEFTIDVGSDKVEKDDMVFNSLGVVGVITKVYKNSSLVMPLTNPNLNLTVTIKNNDEDVYGIINGYDKLNNLLIINELTSNVSDGKVLTSEFSNRYKSGLLIGDVYTSYRSSDGISYVLFAKPVVNYNDIRYVCVIK